MPKTLRIGLIGCGNIAPAHLTCYQQNERTTVVAVADINRDAAEALGAKADAAAYTEYREMLRQEGLDAVSILTPPASHRQVATDTAEAGVHALCEKPLAMTAAHGRAMAATARTHGRRLMVAQCHKFHEPVRRARELVINGDLGELSTYRNRFGYLRGTPDDRTRGRGGVLLDNGSHSSYLFRYLVGPVIHVSGRAPEEQLERIDELCVCTLLVDSQNGVGGTIELDGAARPCPNEVQLFGTAGSVTIDYSGGPSLFRPAEGDPVPLDDPSLPGNHRFQREIDHFVACILGEAEPEIHAREGIADLAVLEAAYQAMRSGQRVTL